MTEQRGYSRKLPEPEVDGSNINRKSRKDAGDNYHDRHESDTDEIHVETTSTLGVATKTAGSSDRYKYVKAIT